MPEPIGYGRYIRRIHACMEAEANRNLEKRNLTLSQSHFLMELRHRPNQCAALKELETCFQSAQSSIASLAVRLEKKGLVERFTDPQDKRVKYVRLTQAGQESCDTSMSEILATEEHLLAGLSECERTLLLNLLQRLFNNVKAPQDRL